MKIGLNEDKRTRFGYNHQQFIWSASQKIQKHQDRLLHLHSLQGYRKRSDSILLFTENWIKTPSLWRHHQLCPQKVQSLSLQSKLSTNWQKFQPRVLPHPNRPLSHLARWTYYPPKRLPINHGKRLHSQDHSFSYWNLSNKKNPPFPLTDPKIHWN